VSFPKHSRLGPHPGAALSSISEDGAFPVVPSEDANNATLLQQSIQQQQAQEAASFHQYQQFCALQELNSFSQSQQQPSRQGDSPYFDIESQLERAAGMDSHV